MKIEIPSHLSDHDLVVQVKSLAQCEREATASFVSHLGELDARRLYLGAGFSSLFGYCCEILHLSEPAAYNRIEVARAARTFPVILSMLAEGSLSLATARLLAAKLTAENQEVLLAAAAGRSKRQVEEMLFQYFPRPDVPSAVRKLPTAKVPVAPAVAVLPASSDAQAVELLGILPSSVTSPSVPPDQERRPVVRPLAPDRYEVRFTASAETREKLRLAQDLLRHAIPTGDLAEVIDRALTTLLKDLAQKKLAATKRPRTSRGTAPGSRDIPAKVQRAVWVRDGGVCAFVSKSGRRCRERGFIELHHVDPHGVGGEATVENIQLLCRAHNAYESELFYGRAGPPGRRTLPGKSASPSSLHAK